jgi:hypothetical protein
MLGAITEDAIKASGTEIGMFVFQKGPGLGLVVGGKQGEFNENVVPFLKEAVKRIQEVIDETGKGGISLTDKCQDYYIYDTKKGVFKTVPRDDGQNPHQRN